MENLVGWELAGERAELAENPSRYHTVLHKSHRHYPGIKPGPQWSCPSANQAIPRHLQNQKLLVAQRRTVRSQTNWNGLGRKRFEGDRLWKIMKILSQYSQCSSRDSNLEPPGYKSKALPLRQPARWLSYIELIFWDAMLPLALELTVLLSLFSPLSLWWMFLFSFIMNLTPVIINFGSL